MSTLKDLTVEIKKLSSREDHASLVVVLTVAVETYLAGYEVNTIKPAYSGPSDNPQEEAEILIKLSKKQRYSV